MWKRYSRLDLFYIPTYLPTHFIGPESRYYIKNVASASQISKKLRVSYLRQDRIESEFMKPEYGGCWDVMEKIEVETKLTHMWNEK